MTKSKMTILLSRTDSIGDVILSLPMAGIIKEKFPNSRVLFLGKSYTKEIVACSKYVDKFINWTELKQKKETEQIASLKAENIDIFVHVFPNKEIAKIAKKAKIKSRIGTSHRPYHYLYCNQLESFSRKNSTLHEAQLNILLLKSLSITYSGDFKALERYYGFDNIAPLAPQWKALLHTDKPTIIIQSKSKGSAREWGLTNFASLIQLAIAKGARVFLTGTEEEGLLFRKELLFKHPDLIDISGQMTLKELVSFIAHADFLVAASTGPLHIAAATGTKAIGIYPPIKPMDPGRWAPIGKNTSVFVLDKPQCTDCKDGGICNCMLAIKAEDIIKEIYL